MLTVYMWFIKKNCIQKCFLLHWLYKLIIAQEPICPDAMTANVRSHICLQEAEPCRDYVDNHLGPAVSPIQPRTFLVRF